MVVTETGVGESVHREGVSSLPVWNEKEWLIPLAVDEFFIDGDIDKAVRVAFNAKTQRYGTCNTMETLLVHQAIAGRVLPELATLYQAEGVELRGCDRTRTILAGISAAEEQDWDEEYLAREVAHCIGLDAICGVPSL